MEEDPHQDPQDEGEGCNTQADGSHLQEAAAEVQVPGHRGVEGEDDDDDDGIQDGDGESEIEAREDKIGGDQEYDGDDVRDEGVCRGLDGVPPLALGLGGEVLGRAHGEGCRDPGDESSHGDDPGVLEGEGEPCQGPGKLHEGVVQAEDDGSRVPEALLVYKGDEGLLVPLLVEEHLPEAGNEGEEVPVDLLGLLLATLHQLEGEGDPEDAIHQEVKGDPDPARGEVEAGEGPEEPVMGEFDSSGLLEDLPVPGLQCLQGEGFVDLVLGDLALL